MSPSKVCQTTKAESVANMCSEVREKQSIVVCLTSYETHECQKPLKEHQKIASKLCIESSRTESKHETSEQTLHGTERTKQARKSVKLASKPCIENSMTERTKQSREPMCIIAVLRRGFCTLVL